MGACRWRQRSDQLKHDPHAIGPFAERYRAAVDNPRLAANVARYQRNWRVSRDKSLEEIEFDRLRDAFKTTKTRVQDRLDEYLTQFQRSAEARGATVHHAGTAADANRIVLEICRRHGAKQIVKSKSMVSEEIELNHFLDGQGIACVETDLGEWIVQKAGQAAESHRRPGAAHGSRRCRRTAQ